MALYKVSNKVKMVMEVEIALTYTLYTKVVPTLHPPLIF